MLGRLVDEHQRYRAVDAVWGNTVTTLRELDGLVINLECCLSDRGSPWRRTRRVFHFRADPEWAIPALRRAGVDACALANNHVLDFEETALRDTLSHLDEAGIERSGAGTDLEEALAPASFAADGVDVAVVSLTDNTHEYAAGQTSPGTAWIEIDRGDPETRARVEDALSRVQELDSDLVIASLHWGPNMVEEPPESFRTFARWLVDMGVDAVHGHSAHLFHGIEVYESAPIIYDAGDFVDDYAVNPRRRNDRSFLFVLSADSAGTPKTLRLVPTEIHDCSVHLAGEDAAAWSRSRMRSLSSEFGTEFERADEALIVNLGK